MSRIFDDPTPLGLHGGLPLLALQAGEAGGLVWRPSAAKTPVFKAL
jgi:hypothetical protein